MRRSPDREVFYWGDRAQQIRTLRTLFTVFATRDCLLNRTGRKIYAPMPSLERIATRLASINRELAMLKLRLVREHARAIKVTSARRKPAKRKSV